MKRIFAGVAVLFLIMNPTVGSITAQAQSQDDEIRAVVRTLFDGMRAGDSTMVRSVFDPSMEVLTSTFSTDGVPRSSDLKIDDFVRAVGTPHDQTWNEQVWDMEVRVRDNLASAWMKFAFFRGDQFTHCGVNSFQFKRTEDGWKMIFLADTRQQEGCEMPPGFK